MQWYRFYDEALDDPKVQQLPPALFKHWVNLLCLANKGTPRGTIKQDFHAIAFRLRVSESEAREVIKTLTGYELIEATDDGKLIPHNWENRQRKSDSSADRVAAHRERLKGSNDTETLQVEEDVTNGNALEQNREELETDTDSETEGEKETSAPAGASGDSPYRVLEILCETTNRNIKKLTTREKNYSLAVAKRLLDDEVTCAEVRGFVGYLQAEHWRTGPITMKTIEDGIGTWRADGAPALPKARGSPNGARIGADSRPMFDYGARLREQGQ